MKNIIKMDEFVHQSIWYKNLLENPTEIAALFPCSTETGKLMTAHLEGMDEGYILELGSGMGAITECILQRQVPEDKLILIEKNKNFADYLSHKYRNANVFAEDAANAKTLLEAQGICEVRHIVCSLPFVIIQQEQQLSILDVIFKLLHPQGCVSIVTYFIRCPISKKVLDQYNKSSELFGFTMKNIPPAYVYQIKSGHR
jgi:phospholipid N-methyltransferase